MKKVHREFIVRVRAEGLAIERAEPSSDGHFRVDIRHLDGRLQKLKMSMSPKVHEEAISHSLRTVHKFARGEL